MNLNTITEVRRITGKGDINFDSREGDGWLAGGTWRFSEPQPHLRRLLDLRGFDWETLVVGEQGLGRALYERMMFDEEGQVVNSTLRNHRIPTFAYVPRTEVHSADTHAAAGPLGAKGMGERPTNPVSRRRWPTRSPTRPAFALASPRSRWIKATAVSSSVTSFDD